MEFDKMYKYYPAAFNYDTTDRYKRSNNGVIVILNMDDQYKIENNKIIIENNVLSDKIKRLNICKNENVEYYYLLFDKYMIILDNMLKNYYSSHWDDRYFSINEWKIKELLE